MASSGSTTTGGGSCAVSAPGRTPLLHPLGSYPVISASWPAEEFDRLPPTPPLSIFALALRSPSLRLRDLVHADYALGLSLLRFDPEQTYAQLDHVSAEQFLAGLRLSQRARLMLFNVFAHSFFNDAASMSAAELVAMFHFFFMGNPEGLGMDAPHADYHSAIWTPLAPLRRTAGCAHRDRHTGPQDGPRGRRALAGPHRRR